MCAIMSGCGGGHSPADSKTTPDLAGFLRLPVATPTSCPASANGATSGRRSPWVGHVDVSVFVTTKTRPARVTALRDALVRLPKIRTVYFESKTEAYAEFQRLYTCSTQLRPGDLPASYRIVLDTITRPERDDLVRAIYRLPGVGTVSCDPSSPCVDVRRGG
jgi:hypothetical protein